MLGNGCIFSPPSTYGGHLNAQIGSYVGEGKNRAILSGETAVPIG